MYKKIIINSVLLVVCLIGFAFLFKYLSIWKTNLDAARAQQERLRAEKVQSDKWQELQRQIPPEDRTKPMTDEEFDAAIKKMQQK